jgi:periplasmic protein TonB
VQSAIADAMRRNTATKKATMSVQARVWADSTGRITRAQLVNSTGDAALDAALKNDILTGLQLSEAPPSDMPMPINLRLNARKPN